MPDFEAVLYPTGTEQSTIADEHTEEPEHERQLPCNQVSSENDLSSKSEGRPVSRTVRAVSAWHTALQEAGAVRL